MNAVSKTAGQNKRPAAAPLSAAAAEVERIRDCIARQYHPETIILFGSAASGRAGEGSDIDLLIIKRTNKPYFDRVLEVRRAIDTSRPVDILVLTPQEYEQALAEKRYLIVEEILPKGRTIYERPRTRRRRSRVA